MLIYGHYRTHHLFWKYSHLCHLIIVGARVAICCILDIKLWEIRG